MISMFVQTSGIAYSNVYRADDRPLCMCIYLDYAKDKVLNITARLPGKQATSRRVCRQHICLPTGESVLHVEKLSTREEVE